MRVRNTKYAYGLVLYAGKESKLALNSVAPPSKFSRTEKKINMCDVFTRLSPIVLTVYLTA